MTRTAPAAENTRTTHRHLVVAGLMLAMGVVALDVTIVATAVPSIVGQLGGFSLFAWLFSAYLLGQTISVPVYGRLSDLYGRKPILLTGVTVFVLASAAAGAAWNMGALIAFRGLQGLGAGAVISTVNTVASDLYRIEERGKVQGWLSSVWGIAAVLGPTLGGVLATYASWRWIFYLNLPVGATCLIVLSRHLHENVTRRRHRIDVAGAVLLMIAVAAAVLGLMQGGVAWDWGSVSSLTVFGISLVGFVAFAWQERHAAEPTLPPWVFGDPPGQEGARATIGTRALFGANVASCVFGLAAIGLTAYLPTYAQGVLGAGPITAGLTLAVMSIGWPLASSLSNRLYLRIGFRDTACVGAVICLVAAGCLVALPERVPLYVVGGSALLMGAGFGLVSTSVLVGAQSLVEWGRRGVVTATNMSMRYLGQTMGAALFAGIANSTLAGWLDRAPGSLSGQLPATVDEASGPLAAERSLSDGAAEYLRHGRYLAAHHVFLGLLAIAAVLLAVLLFATPRWFGRRASQPEPVAQADPAT